LDYNRFYAQTMTLATCNATQQCQISIPFNGSGITIRGVLVPYPGAPNFTVSLDGKVAPAPTLLPSLAEAAPPTYNATLYDIQSLPITSHALTITIVPWQNATTTLSFDYAYVNVTTPSPTLSSAPTSAPTTTETSVTSQRSHAVVGAAVGGSLAGLAIVATIFFALVYFRRKRRAMLATGAEPNYRPFNTSKASLRTPRPFIAYSPVPSSPNTTTPLHPSSKNFGLGHNLHPESLSSSDPSILPMSQTTIADSGLRSSNMTSPESSTKDPNPSADMPSSPHASSSANELSNEQVDFIHTLYSHNIPAPAIARVMERMIEGQEVGAPDDFTSGLSHASTSATIAPPPTYSDIA